MNLNRRVRNLGEVLTGRKVPPLLAKVEVNETPIPGKEAPNK